MTRMIRFFGLALLVGATAGAQSQAPPPPPGAAPAPQAAQPQQQGARPDRHSAPGSSLFQSPSKTPGPARRRSHPDEFRIFADNVEQKIAGFSAEAVPLSAVVLLDNDLNERVASQVQKSLTTIAAGFGPSDEVALVTYDQFPETVSDFSFNNDALFTSLKRLELGSHNGAVNAGPTSTGPIGAGPPPSTAGPIGSGPPPAASVQVHGSQRYKNTDALNDALFSAGDMLKARGRDRRKIIFLISDGTNVERNEHSFDETLRSLLVGDISVYSISVTRSVPVGKSLLQKGAAELDKYANGHGRRHFLRRQAAGA